jgi:hypothetical protein
MKSANLPSFILTYITGLLVSPWRFTLVYLSLRVGKSHDYLTRGLAKKYPWKDLLRSLASTQTLSAGYIVFDETDIDKSFGEKVPCLGWIFSHRKNKYIFGLHLIVIAWTNGKVTIPLGWKIYQKGSGKTKIDLALELINYVVFVLGVRPKAFLFDSLYAAEKVLRFLVIHNLIFYSQLPSNRLFEGKQLHIHHNNRPYWTAVGYIKGKLYVQIVKNRKKYYITNEVGVARKEQLATYKLRWKIEEVFRFTKQSCGLEKCQVTSLQGQHNHFGSCFLLYALLQDMKKKTSLTDYRIKELATFDREFVDSLNLTAYLSGA